jgi:hypothetical protein
VLAQPGVVYAIEDEPLEEWALVQKALEGALAELLAMRAREGASLATELEHHLAATMVIRDDIELLSDGLADRLQRRLEERMERLVGDRVDPARLAQEIAVLVDRSDLSEELARIRSHCAQLAENAPYRGARRPEARLPAPGAQPRGQHDRQQGRGAHDRGARRRAQVDARTDARAGGERRVDAVSCDGCLIARGSPKEVVGGRS